MSETLEREQPVAYKSPLYEMTQTTPTCLWNDSATLSELTYSIEHGAVGATCNPVIVLDALKKEAHLWNDRIRALAVEFPAATEEEIGWKLVEEISAKRAELLRPAFESTRAGTAGSRFRPTRITIAIQPPCWSRRCASMP
jgi:transaldolase